MRGDSRASERRSESCERDRGRRRPCGSAVILRAEPASVKKSAAEAARRCAAGPELPSARRRSANRRFFAATLEPGTVMARTMAKCLRGSHAQRHTLRGVQASSMSVGREGAETSLEESRSRIVGIYNSIGYDISGLAISDLIPNKFIMLSHRKRVQIFPCLEAGTSPTKR